MPVILLIIWAIGSLWLAALWVLLVTALLFCFFINPAIYVESWTHSNSQWGQMWMAQHYAAGTGGLRQSKSTARRWYQWAAENEYGDAQYEFAVRMIRGKKNTPKQQQTLKKWATTAQINKNDYSLATTMKSGVKLIENCFIRMCHALKLRRFATQTAKAYPWVPRASWQK